MNDAKGCFDRIQLTFAALVLVYYGVAWSVATTLFEVLQKAQHKIKTSYGVSDPVYGKKESAISGIGQSNGLDPALWAFINSIIFEMCKARGHGTVVTTSVSKEDVSLLGFAFIYDADLVSGAENIYTTCTTMIAWFQALKTCQNDGILATGGLIGPEKSCWFLTAFFWDGLDWAYHTKDTLPGEMPYHFIHAFSALQNDCHSIHGTKIE